MDDEQLQRYSRHILLPSLQIEGQQKICDAKVFIVGLGGLGCAAALYLAASGIGQFFLADGDSVDLSNLQRQIAHSTDSIGKPKVLSAMQAMRALNPEIKITPIEKQLTATDLLEYVNQVDAVLDCSDNFTTRFSLNKICWQAKKPLIMGAAIRMEGQVSVFHSNLSCNPCYACLYPQEEIEEEEIGCVHTGVLAPVVGVIGSLQAVECLKIITGVGNTLVGRLLIWNAASQQWREIKINKDEQCLVCGLSLDS